MLDIKFIRENKELVQTGAYKKHVKFDVNELLRVDDERREAQGELDEMRAEQNHITDAVSKAKESGAKQVLIMSTRELKERIQKKEEELNKLMDLWRKLMVSVPNIPDISVPDGKDDEENEEVHVWGEKPEFSFTPKNHIELMQGLDLADFERGAKVAGFRGYFLKNDLVSLSLALWNLTLEHFLKKGFVPFFAPSLVKKQSLIGTGYLPQGEEDLYKTQDESYLAGTSEVAQMSYFQDEVLEQKQLPLKFLVFSPCFRREAGSYGKDTKGLIRVHEFFKFEQIVLCEAGHEESVRLHEEITRNAEELIEKLKLPYRKVINCGGDLGLGQVKKYDLETWVPSEKKYRETHSSSYFHDFQTRRLNIRYRDDKGKLHFAHSLNNTALATPRILVSILENNQQEDGTIKVPEVLQPFLQKEIIAKL